VSQAPLASNAMLYPDNDHESLYTMDIEELKHTHTNQRMSAVSENDGHSQPPVSELSLGTMDYIRNFTKSTNFRSTFNFRYNTRTQPPLRPRVIHFVDIHATSSNTSMEPANFGLNETSGSSSFPTYGSFQSSLNIPYPDLANLAPYTQSLDAPLQWNDTDGQYLDFAPYNTVPPNTYYPKIPYNTLQAPEYSSHPLHGKTQDIWDKLRMTAAVKSARLESNSVQPSAYEIKLFTATRSAECLEFFSPINLERYLARFWSHWHLHAPMIHPSTYNPINESASLLCSIALLGAFFESEEDAIKARSWLDLAEEMAFDDPLLEDDLEHGVAGLSLQETRQRLRSLQAAYCICIAQNWEGNNTAKQRVRRRRYSTLIAVSSI